ncbi:hypothetical protein EZV73_27700 [Acidaminobacter sp. JC074]|uniref:hypothetical protein n=1 Tax=Acidaminobacter sp. JC074 TaxID=2530199 RepID=UPI001F0E2A5A|nr:hypothetical protein [Acidaminobacter sp. JC074]MCH4891387.1 hypothetical protein [Acidaminobacter sp. JC074]
MQELMKNKVKAMLNLRDEKIKQGEQAMEVYVHEIGWLVLLLEDVEVVTDNWFTSNRYIKSDILSDDEGVSVTIKNVYVKNKASVHTESNPKYNLMFDKIMLFSDQIIACL